MTMPKEMLLDLAVLLLPRDVDNWRSRCETAHDTLATSEYFPEIAWIPAKVAEFAFESMGYEYFEVKHGAWRRRLSSLAFKHWGLVREDTKDQNLV